MTKLILLLVCFITTPAKSSSDWIYTVREGDTLWNLCETYTNVANCWLKIGEYNGVEYPRVMAPGTRIRFPARWLKNPPVAVKITYHRGEVLKVFESGETHTAKINDELSMGEGIRTGENATVTLLFGDGSVIVVEENSDLKMDLLSIVGKDGFVDSRVNLLRGAVRTHVPKSQSPGYADRSSSGRPLSIKPPIRRRFRVKTPSAIAAVRGTEFRVSARENGEKMLGEVYSGEISVSANSPVVSSEKNIPKKYGIVAKKNTALTNPVELLSPPIIITGETQQFAPLTVYWKDLLNARRYIASLFPKDQPNNLLQKIETGANHVVFEKLKYDCYIFSLRGVDVLGLQGLAKEKEFCIARPPAAPVASISHDKEYGSSTLTWSEIAGAKEYRLEFSKQESFDEVEKSIPAYSTSYEMTRVEKRYYPWVRVKAVVSDAVISPASEIIKTSQ